MGKVNRDGEAYLSRGAIVIRVPVRNLAGGIERAWPNHMNTRYRVTNADEFASWLLYELNREEEDGTTPIHRLLDKCVAAAVENGALGIEEHEEQEV